MEEHLEVTTSLVFEKNLPCKRINWFTAARGRCVSEVISDDHIRSSLGFVQLKQSWL